VHVEDNDMTCDNCHQHYMDRSYSGRPVNAICIDCHDDPSSDSPLEKRLRVFLDKGEEVPWKRLYRVAKHVRYSHARHVKGGGIECAVCHGAIAETVKPPERPLKRFSMNFCLDCHRSQGVSTDCILCHR